MIGEKEDSFPKRIFRIKRVNRIRFLDVHLAGVICIVVFWEFYIDQLVFTVTILKQV